MPRCTAIVLTRKREIKEIFTSIRAPGVCNPHDAQKEVLPEDDFVPVAPV